MKDFDYRHQYIKDQLELNGMIRVQDIADKLGVTGATIRRDLRILESQNALQRSYGCAYPVKGKATDLPLSEKYSLHSSEKARIAKAATALIEENDSFIITSGSTMEAFSRFFMPKGFHNVVTASIRLADILCQKSGVSVSILGGKLVKDSLSVRDSVSIEQLRHVHCNKLFFSCDGFDREAGVTSEYIEESQLNVAMVEAATTKILLADSSKLGKVGFGKTCDLKDIDVLVTDSGVSGKVKEQIELLGVRVIVA